MLFNPIMLDVAEQLESERLQLRAIKPGDGAVHYPALVESLQDLKKHLWHLPWLIDEPSLPNSEKYCRNSYSNFVRRETLAYFIYTKSEQRLVGWVGLVRIDWDVPRFEVGYWCRSSAVGNGYIVEAVNALTDYALSKLSAKRVEIRVDDINIRSWKVAEAAGFKLEGILRNWERDGRNGALLDLRVYSKIA